MKKHTRKWLDLAALAAVCAVIASPALAQDNGTGTASGAMPAHAHDMDRAHMNAGAQTDADASGMPQEEHQGDVTFVSGGVGLDESHALRSAAPHWPLDLRFTGPGSDYLADVSVTINDAHGKPVLETVAHGPYMLVRIKPGSYVIHANYKGQEKTQSVRVSASGHARASFSWNQQ